ncbi:hypothetical protein FHY71_13310 [Bacillus tropicus]|uniref:Uncharacterized protein n=1 Tax=Bacillus tropicus TaxID=2026188 RepID=A0A5C5A6U0_9BACI|nr:hypothetical protein [Bacillus tropicus]TNP14293.1 hypothetical protein FHY71_13310 [Bacillus tropicus]TNP15861.1 hypothetical protein FHY73_21605 [Bacillus tropicus]
MLAHLFLFIICQFIRCYTYIVFYGKYIIFLFLGQFDPALTGSKPPTSKFSGSKEVRWGINCP